MLERLLEHITLAPDELAWLEEGLRDPWAETGVRGVFFEIITRELLKEADFEVIATCEDFLSHLSSPAPFSFAPLSEFILAFVLAVRLIRPHTPLIEAIQEVSEATALRAEQLPVFKGFYAACGGDPLRFFEAAASSNVFFQNSSIQTLPETARSVIIRYERLPIGLLGEIFRGYFRGLLKTFGYDALIDIEIDHIEPGVAEFYIQW